MTFLEKLAARAAKANSLLCIGLDPDPSKIPNQLSLLDFNKAIIDATAEFACAFKPNSAFYEAHGADGIEALRQTCAHIQTTYPEIPIILDFKRADIGNTNDQSAAFAFDYLGADAVTVQPYFGQEAVQPFLDHTDKGIIVLCRTSNPGAEEFQDLDVGSKKLYLQVAENVSTKWNGNSNCLLVVGATNPEELAEVRRVVGEEMYLLVPGIGAQGGDIEATLKAGGDKLIINSGRAILYAGDGDDFAEAAAPEARKTRDEINQHRGGNHGNA